MAFLVYQDERGTERRYTITGTVTTIGRLDANDIVLHDPLVSRKHCRIELADGVWSIVDLESRYGTYLDNERVQGSRRLSPGARLRIGNTPVQLLDVAAGQSDVSDTGIGGKTRGIVPGEPVSEISRVTAEFTAASLTMRMTAATKLADEVLAAFLSGGKGLTDQKVAVSARELRDNLIATKDALAELERNKILGQTLAEVGKLINLVTDLDTVLTLTMDMAVRALGAERGFILLREDGALVTRVQKNMGAQRGISTSIAENVVNGGTPILTTDAQVDARFSAVESVMAHGIHAVMCVPLRDKAQKTFGAIFIDGRPGNPMFSPSGMEFLAGFASQAALSIENAQLVTRHATEERNRQKLMRFLSKNVAEDILASSGGSKLVGQAREITVIFTDIRGFTSLLEKLSPTEAVEMLNDYFTEIVDDLDAEDGTLDKYTGDGVLAFFGAPKEQPDHAIRAVRASLKMQARLPALLQRWKDGTKSFAKQTEGLGTGIGIHTGPAVVGEMGSPKRVEYTAIGDTVNIAARVQGIAASGEVLVTRGTLDALGPKVVVEALPPMALKGKSQGVEIFRVVSLG